jgi:hypothetical protein
VSDGTATLQVARSAGGAWTFVRDAGGGCLPVPQDPTRWVDADAGVSCAAVGAALQTDAADAQPVSEEQVRAADPVLEAVGLEPADARVDLADLSSVTVQLTAAGLTVAGADTSLTVDADGVAWAHGWAATGTDEGASYPLVPARAAYDSLAGPAQEMTVECVQAPCEATPTRIDRVELGLSVQHDADGPVLVPSWLFFPEGEAAAFPLVAVAVDPAYLGPPDQPEPADPPQDVVPPVAGQVEPAPGQAHGSGSAGAPAAQAGEARPVPFQDVVAALDDVELQVSVLAPSETGPCAARLDAQVRETDERVELTVVAHLAPVPPGAAVRCPDEARTLTVPLAAPLGERELVDGAARG